MRTEVWSDDLWRLTTANVSEVAGFSYLEPRRAHLRHHPAEWRRGCDVRRHHRKGVSGNQGRHWGRSRIRIRLRRQRSPSPCAPCPASRAREPTCRGDDQGRTTQCNFGGWDGSVGFGSFTHFNHRDVMDAAIEGIRRRPFRYGNRYCIVFDLGIPPFLAILFDVDSARRRDRCRAAEPR